MKKLPIALGLAIVFLIAGCSSSSSGGGGTATSPPTTPATTTSSAPVGAVGAAGIAAAKKQIKANWATFFKSATPHSKAVSLLQNGANLGPAVRFAAKIAKKAGTKESAKVTKITFPSPTTATIIYNLYGNGKVLLPNANGQAILDAGVWKVTQVTFCTLVDLGAAGKKVPGC
jgi:hypothetical protein